MTAVRPCGNCGQPMRCSKQRHCPCELGSECPVTGRVCPECWRTIARNAADRARESPGFPSSYAQPTTGMVAS